MSVFKNPINYCLVFCLTLIIPLCIPSLVQATIYYVAKTGNNSNPGTETRPWLTLQEAANTMVAGDTVYVKEGDYSGTVVSITGSGTADNYISYLAYPGDTPIIGQLYFEYGASYNKFVGFEIIYPSRGGVVMDRNNDHNIVSNCRIHDIGSVGVDLSGGSDFNIVEDCAIYDCAVYAIHTSATTNRGNIFQRNECYRIGDDGFNFSPSTKDTQLIGNVIYDVGQDGNGTADGIHLYDDGSTIVRGNLVYHDGGATGGVFWIHGGSNHIIENNTFVGLPGFSTSYGGIIWLEMTSNVILKNNIAYSSDGSIGVVMGINSSTNDDYNDWYNKEDNSMCVRYGGEWKSVSEYQKEDKRGLHCISLDPDFVNPVSGEDGDFHLKPGSPCEDAGENGADMGAYGVAIPDSGNGEETKVRNRPNPFQAGRGNTYIEYELSQPSNVIITIYDLLGQEVWRKSYEAGENGGREKNNVVAWDGRNLSGEVVGNGGYICRVWIERENKYAIRKIAVAK